MSETRTVRCPRCDADIDVRMIDSQTPEAQVYCGRCQRPWGTEPSSSGFVLVGLDELAGGAAHVRCPRCDAEAWLKRDSYGRLLSSVRCGSCNETYFPNQIGATVHCWSYPPTTGSEAAQHGVEGLMSRLPEYRSRDPLVSFLYLLIRDDVVAGRVTRLVGESCATPEAIFTNGHLARFAESLAHELHYPAGGLQ